MAADDGKKLAPVKALVDLDDPDFDDADLERAEREPPDTARPDFDTNEFAQQVESAEQRMTQPPSPTYEMLRDSCKTGVAQEMGLDEEQILRPSSRKHKLV